MAELDDMLSESLKRAATPGDPTGVADAIRARVAAGDTGTPASTSGFGAASAPLSWLPWIGVVVVAGLAGAAIGVSGFVGRPTVEVAVVGSTTILTTDAPAAACPGGPAIATVPADTRVLAVAQSDDAAHLGVRDPDDFSSILWLSTSDVAVDEGQTAVLPTGAPCPVAVIAAPEPAPAPTPTPTEAPGPVPDDTTGPSLSASAQPTIITMQGFSAYCGPDVSTVSVSADDPSGIAGVTASWSGGSANLSGSGSSWSFGFSEDTTGVADTPYTITLTATDGAGNTSSTAVVVTVTYCLI
jgi:hypothetical protein